MAHICRQVCIDELEGVDHAEGHGTRGTTSSEGGSEPCRESSCLTVRQKPAADPFFTREIDGLLSRDEGAICEVPSPQACDALRPDNGARALEHPAVLRSARVTCHLRLQQDLPGHRVMRPRVLDGLFEEIVLYLVQS